LWSWVWTGKYDMVMVVMLLDGCVCLVGYGEGLGLCLLWELELCCLWTGCLTCLAGRLLALYR
jgi:hypothetical protein